MAAKLAWQAASTTQFLGEQCLMLTRPQPIRASVTEKYVGQIFQYIFENCQALRLRAESMMHCIQAVLQQVKCR